jgi:glycerol-3-phosphate dehydrogenase
VERIPTIQPDQLRGGIVYFDGQFDDARLAIALARTASAKGAVLLNHAPVTALVKENGKVRGAIVRDVESGREVTIRAACVVNATGVFADRVRQMDEPDATPLLSPSQGIHLVLPKKFLSGTSALMVPRTDDGRVLFLVPWHGRAILGTTDTPISEVSTDPHALEEEVAFLLKHAARYLTQAPERSDVLAVYVGLRPLVKGKGEDGKTRTLSRDHSLFISASGLLTIVGGKWTTYRKMAEDTVDRAMEVAEMDARPCVTDKLALLGAPPSEKGTRPLGGTAGEVLGIYGTEASSVRALAESDPELAQQIHPRLPYLFSEIVWAVRYEMARTLEAVLTRRTRALVLDARAAAECAPAVAKRMAKELGRSAEWEAEQVKAFQKRVEASLL